MSFQAPYISIYGGIDENDVVLQVYMVYLIYLVGGYKPGRQIEDPITPAVALFHSLRWASFNHGDV